MKVTIISQNLQGVNDLGKWDIVKNYYWPFRASIDFLYFQEHKLRGSRLVEFGKAIWP